MTKEVIDGRSIFVVQGCAVYKTMNKTSHTPFCYFYKKGVSNAQHLTLCTLGNDAD